jgi:hypothetical protein
MYRLFVRTLAVTLLALPGARAVWAYVEAPYTLGKVIQDSTNVVLVEVTRVQKEKGLILLKKIKDLKGTYDGDQLKHNIGAGDRGYHPRETKHVMSWAAVGERAVFFCNEEASETCIGTYWYQCYREDQWWGMSHAEPYLLRTYCGDADDLAHAVKDILAGKEVVVPCLVNANQQQLHDRKGKLQRLKASLTRLEYDARRDFVGYGAEGVDVVEHQTDVLLSEGSGGWKFVPAVVVANLENRWITPEYDDSRWRTGKAPIGYGEEEINTRAGTGIDERGQAFVFRRAVDIPAALLGKKETKFQVSVAADNCAHVWVNGASVLDEGEDDHEFSYWNQVVDVEAKLLTPGRNVIAVYVPNGAESSDLYLDLQFIAETPLPSKQPASPKIAASQSKSARPSAAENTSPESRAKTGAVTAGDDAPAVEITIDRQQRTISIPCRIAARKLPNLSEIYPLEVIATAPPPRGRKAHETLVTTDVRASQVHAALETLGLKPGQPAKGEGTRASGPEVTLALELTGAADKTKLVAIEKALIDIKTDKPPTRLKWFFTGSVLKQPDPEREETVYAADLSGTLIAIFPVTNETVIQSHLTMADEPTLKLEANKAVLPAEGTAVKLVIGIK